MENDQTVAVEAGDELPPLDWSSCEVDYDERVDDVRLGGY